MIISTNNINPNPILSAPFFICFGFFLFINCYNFVGVYLFGRRKREREKGGIEREEKGKEREKGRERERRERKRKEKRKEKEKN